MITAPLNIRPAMFTKCVPGVRALYPAEPFRGCSRHCHMLRYSCGFQKKILLCFRHRWTTLPRPLVLIKPLQRQMLQCCQQMLSG